MKLSQTTLYLSCAFLAACGTTPIAPSDKHIKQTAAEVTHDNADIPQASRRSIPLPPPTPAPKVETYSVVVSNVSAQEILFALARDAKINIDIHSGIEGNVTLNAINQTLPQILSRIAQQVDMRYELSNGNLSVMPDDPYLKQYKIDYVNMSRDSDSTVSNSSQLGGAGATGTNSSVLAIKNASKNHFWETLTKNITDILRETDQILPEGSSETTVQKSLNSSTTGTGAQTAAGKKQTAKAGFENSPNPAALEEDGTTVTRRVNFREKASVISNPESGVITVRATGRQHEKIQAFVDQVMTSARRQVLIEATIVEVSLSDNYKQGIDWSKVLTAGGDPKGFILGQKGTPVTPATADKGSLVVNYTNPGSQYGDINTSISLLETFGNVKVLSSPKLSVMNNQTAMLRVVDNLVYFTIQANTTTNQTTTTTTYSTTAVTVPTGFTMSLTPQINDSDSVLINLRPSISRLLKYVDDPNPDLKKAGVTSSIPQLQTREMESILRIENNQVAILGGLMEDRINKNTQEIPLLGRLPLIGNLFQNRDDTTTKTELVIFLRPTVIKDASLDGDYKEFRNSLPKDDFLKEDATGAPITAINR